MSRKKHKTTLNHQIKQQEKHSKGQTDEIGFYKNNREYLILSAILLLFLGIASRGLGQFFTTDETFWFFQWVQQYWEAYTTGNLRDTSFSSYPGATIAFVAGIANFFLDQQAYLSYNKIETYFFWWRMPILLTNTLVLFFTYTYLKKLFNSQQALFMVFFIAFTPIILGMSRIVNPDSLVWGFMLISILAFILAIREEKNTNTIVSGIFMGLALATKLSAIGLFAFQIILIFLDYFFENIEQKKLKRAAIKLIVNWIIALIVFTIFLPAAIIKPEIYWARIFRFFALNPIFIALLALLIADIFLLNTKISTAIKNKFNIKTLISRASVVLLILLILISFILKWTAITPTENYISGLGDLSVQYALQKNFISFFIFLRPVAIIGMVLFVVKVLSGKKISPQMIISLYALIFILFYLVGTSIQGVKIGNRYAIPIFAFVSIIAVWSFFQFPKIKIILLSLAVVFTALNTSLLYPKHYIFFKNNQYDEGQDQYHWSTGGYEIAQFMNKLPDAQNMKVLADRHSFKFFFKGTTEEITTTLTDSKLKEYDYLCLSSAGLRAYQHSKPMLDYYNMGLEKFSYTVGNKQKGWMGIVKVNKQKKVLKIPNTFDPEFYLDLKKNWTISLWMQHNQPNAGHFMYVGNTQNNGIEFFLQNNQINIKYGEKLIFEIPVQNANKPYHFIWQNRWINQKQRVLAFLNNKLVFEKELQETKTTETKFFIGTKFSGMMNDYRIYNTTLSAQQIALIYNNGNMHFLPELNLNGQKFAPVQHYTYKNQ